MLEKEIIEVKKFRDESTPDLFHSLTETDIDIISLKLCEEPKARFKNHLEINTVREFIIFLSDKNPDMVIKFQKYKTKK